MSTEAAYRWDHLRLEDVHSWAALVDALALADDTEEHYGPEELTEEFQEDGLDPERDTFAVWDGDTLIAFGQVRASPTLNGEGQVRVWLSGGVHPDYRGRGIGRKLFDLSEARGAALARERHPGAPAIWRADGNLEGASVRPLLEHRGYAIVRYFNQMKRPVPGLAVAEVFTPGVQVNVPQDAQSEALRRLHNLAFEDHWGSAHITREAWEEHWNSVSSRRSTSSVALGEGVEGTYDTIELHVDSVSPTGATLLYERLGFEATKVFAAYQRPVTQVAWAPGGVHARRHD